MRDINDFYLYYEDKLKPIIEKNAQVIKKFKIIDGIMYLICVILTVWYAIGISSFGPLIIDIFLIPLFFLKKRKFAYPDYRMRLISGIVNFIDSKFKYRHYDRLNTYGFKQACLSFKYVDRYDVYDIISGHPKDNNIIMAFIEGKNYGAPKIFFVYILVLIIWVIFNTAFVIYTSHINQEHYTSHIMMTIIMIIAIVYSMLNYIYNGSYIFSFTDVGENFLLNVINIFRKEDGFIDLKTVFRGLALKMDFNKDFGGKTIGFSKSFKDKFLDPAIQGNMSEVDLENLDFMNKFDVYFTNQQEARYVLTPLMMEALLGLKSRLNKQMNFSFSNSNMFVVFEQDDLFEMNLFQEINNFESVAGLFIFLSDILDTAECLGLDRRVWTKK